MKRTTTWIAIALVALGGAAAAQPQAPARNPPAPDAPAPDPMAAFYGNTVTIAVPAGYYYTRRFVDPDGTWREPRGADFVRGVWKVEAGQVCSWQTDPVVTNPRHYCYVPVPRAVGDQWITEDPDSGNDVIQTLEAGRR